MAGIMGAAAGMPPDFAAPVTGQVAASIDSVAGAHEAVSAPSHGGGGAGRLPRRIR